MVEKLGMNVGKVSTNYSKNGLMVQKLGIYVCKVSTKL
jgi:hypothetical protein